MSALTGTMLSGRYRLDAQIGSGGMSTVYRALDSVLERRVAIKLMHREIAGDSDQLERFRREARAVAQLSHPHIVGVIDAGEDEGRPYIVFEYVEGETLKDRIRRCGRLEIDEAVAYAIEIARALDGAHSRNIVHRDIKPQNVLIDEEGSAKVTDFGIARSLDEEGLTADGRVLGTTDYVSPEQALGHAVTGQSDIYSLGVVLFEMLTGDVPFQGENQVAVAMKHVREPMPDVQAFRPEVSASLAGVLDHMTDKEVEHRYPDVHTLIADLEEVLAIEAARAGQSTGEATAILKSLPASRRRGIMRSRLPLLFAALSVLLIAAGLALLLTEGRDRVERGTGKGRVKAPEGTTVVSVKRGSARDYDPLGDQEEHREDAHLAVDREPGTVWSTETYTGGVLTKPTGERPGVGIYIDAAPAFAATALEVQSPTPGFEMEVWAAADELPESIESDGWVRLAKGTADAEETRYSLPDDGERYRYYLVWITSLPADRQKVEIDEIVLFRKKA
jgi:eukaryotic-like serine/threonine-protein kinase